jgi:peroxiredoxin
MSISVGQTAPDFMLLNQDKKEVRLSDFAGKKNVVLVWYPLDWSPTCTNEHACFVNDMKAEQGITGRSIAIVNKAGKVAWFKNYDIPVVPDVKEVAAALQQVKAASA